MKNKIGIISILFFFIQILQAQDSIYNFSNDRKISQYIIDNWTKKDGLPTNSLKDIFQTSDGYIWISSYNGLIRLADNHFEIFDKNNIHSLSENGIGDLAEDKKGILWMASQSNGLISLQKEKFIFHNADSNFKKLFPVLYIDKKNRIWGASPIKGWFVFKDNRYKALGNSNIEPSFILQDKNGVMWFATNGSGLIKYQNSKFTVYTTNDGLNSNWLNCIFFDDSNKLWIGTDKGICVFNGKKFNKIPQFNKTSVSSIVYDKNKNLWIGTKDGIFLKRINSNTYEHLSKANGLKYNYIAKLFVDKENSLWVLNYKRGLSRIKSSKFICFTQNQGALGTVVNSICEINPNIILIAYDNGEINLLKNNTLFSFKTKAKLKGKRVRDIFKDSKKNIWISTYDGLLKIQADGKEKWLKLENGFPSKYIRMVFEDSKHNIWVGTRNKGIIRINKDNSYTIFDKNNGLNVNLIMSINEDKQGNIIVGTSKGGLSIIYGNKVISTYTRKKGLISDIIFNTYIDPKGILWIALKGGLNCIENGKITSFPFQKGMLKDTPFDILEDNYGYFWLTCNNGIMRIKRKNLIDYKNGKINKLNCTLYDQYDGLKQAECNSTAKSIKTQNGKLWFPTLDGVAMINPKKIPHNSYVPPIYIAELYIDNIKYGMDTTTEIPANKKRITFVFNNLSYYESKKNLFRYKLVGYEDQWSKATRHNSISYTNLHPGNYIFEVIGCNNDGIWNNKGDKFSFYIMPHFYQTKLFHIILILLFLSIIYLIYIFRVRRLKNNQQELEAIIAKRTFEIREKNEELYHQKEEIQLQADELEKLSIVAKETDNFVLIFNEEMKLSWVNNSYINKFGEVKFYNKTLIEASQKENIKEIVDECIKTKSSASYELEVEDIQGNKIWVQITLTPFFESNQLKKIIVVESDITEIKKAQIALSSQKNYITSSINTAKAIQKTVFPSKEIINKYFDNFILFMPKDIVSGDFYWFTDISKDCRLSNIKEEFISCSLFALVDCTGHGVPGAFMSMLANGLLNEIVNLRKIHDPKKILSALNKNVIKLLKQDTSDNVEGMDVSLCRFSKRKENKTIVIFSGAKLSLFYYKKNQEEIQSIRGDRRSIGGVFFKNSKIEFTNHKLELQKDDIIYLTTDGYIDQNNKNRRRFGRIRFIKILNEIANKPLEKQREILKTQLTNWQENEMQRDDISVIGIKM